MMVMCSSSTISLPHSTCYPVSNKSPNSVQQQQGTLPTVTLENPKSPTSWVETLRSHTQSNQFQQALSVYIDMMNHGIPPDNFAFPPALKAASALHDLNSGKQIHAAAIKTAYQMSSVTVANTLLYMYGKCGGIGDVLNLFDRIPQRDQVSWNSFIAALCQFQEWDLALEAFRSMQLHHIQPNSFTLVSVALACSNLSWRDGIGLGKQVHAYSLRTVSGKTYPWSWVYLLILITRYA